MGAVICGCILYKLGARFHLDGYLDYLDKMLIIDGCPVS